MRAPVVPIALLLAVISATAKADVGTDVMDCYLKRAYSFEPHQDNMRDLAYVLVETECIAERMAFLDAYNMNNPEGLKAFKERTVSEVTSMIVTARAQRLGIPRE